MLKNFFIEYAWLTGIIGSLLGIVLGALRIFEFMLNKKQERKKFNKVLYNSTINMKYTECFDIRGSNETDHNDISKILTLTGRILEFQSRKNKFRGWCIQKQFHK